MELLFLGTGTSHGVPMIGCDCPVCTSPDPRDRRLRASVLLSWDGRNVVVDTTPDFRAQMLAHSVRQVDAVLYTHHHADHIHGIDDLRVLGQRAGRPVPAYAAVRVCRTVHERFPYIFTVDPSNLNVPRMDLREIEGPFELFGKRIVPVPVRHGEDMALGFRVDGLAYAPDCSGIPDESRSLLMGLDALVIDALRPTPHPRHLSVPEALRVIADLTPRRAWLTGISHKLAHAATQTGLPPNVHLACDGLRVTVD